MSGKICTAATAVAVLLMLGAAPAGAGSPVQPTHVGARVGFAWADDPASTLEYSPGDSFDSAKRGAGAGVVPLGTGAWEVVFPRLYAAGQPSNVQVSAEMGEEVCQTGGCGYCTTSGWAEVAHGLGVFVNCYDASGNPQNNYFSVLYQSRVQPFGSGSKGMAFLLADQPTKRNYIPNPTYQYNSTGATNSMVRKGTGSYIATIPGLTRAGGNVQVTAYGSGPARCQTAGSTADQSGTSVKVRCFDSTGAAADEEFALLYTLRVAPAPYRGYSGKFKGAYAWADKPGRTEIYTPARAYNYNGFGGGKLTAQKTGTGRYTLNVPNGLEVGGLVLVSSQGKSGTYCSGGDGFEGWVPIEISCYDQGGNPVDSQFDVTFLD
jgi:hypothetical protein